MKTSGHDHDTGERDAREWAAQERARHQARAGARVPVAQPASGDPGDRDAAAYRRIAEALRRPPPVDLPPGFAAHVARMAEAPVRTASDAAFERILQRALLVAFALCALLTGLAYGARLMEQVRAGIGSDGLQWLALAAACVGLSWSFEWLRRRTRRDDGLRAA